MNPVQRRTATLRCGNEDHLDLWNRCFPNQTDWSDVTLASFVACPSNLAFNRQTRMLPDLELIDWYTQLNNFHNISAEIARFVHLSYLLFDLILTENRELFITR